MKTRYRAETVETVDGETFAVEGRVIDVLESWYGPTNGKLYLRLLIQPDR